MSLIFPSQTQLGKTQVIPQLWGCSSFHVMTQPISVRVRKVMDLGIGTGKAVDLNISSQLGCHLDTHQNTWIYDLLQGAEDLLAFCDTGLSCTELLQVISGENKRFLFCTLPTPDTVHICALPAFHELNERPYNEVLQQMTAQRNDSHLQWNTSLQREKILLLSGQNG